MRSRWVCSDPRCLACRDKRRSLDDRIADAWEYARRASDRAMAAFREAGDRRG